MHIFSFLKGAISVRGLVFTALFVCILGPAAVFASDQVLFREDFNDLSAWKEVFFPKIHKHSVYRIEKNNQESYLVAFSDDSASLIVYKKTFDVYEHPYIRWRWKVSNIYRNADAKVKSGDDYPIRIYCAFEYDPKKAGPFERAVFGTARLIYGEYPPSSSLNYVWSSKVMEQRSISSPYTDRNRMILLEMGSSRSGEWVDEEVNILKDYEEVFGKKPPGHATIGIMNDSDNTHEKAQSYVDYIEVYQK